jgi:hypothetical protein
MVTLGRMDNKAGWFTDYNYIIIFMENVERNIFRNEARWLGRWNRNSYLICFLKTIAAFLGLIVNQDVSGTNQALDARACNLGKLL